MAVFLRSAATGAGLGIRFLKHLQRTRLLLHLVDIAPLDESVDPADSVRAVANELEKFSAELSESPRWLVINKVDLLAADVRAERRDALVAELRWDGPVFEVSAATGEGCEELAQAVMQAIELMDEESMDGDVSDARPTDVNSLEEGEQQA